MESSDDDLILNMEADEFMRRRPVTRSMARRRLREQAQSAATVFAAPTFLCSICYEQQPITQRLIFEACGDRNHACCIQCARQHFQSRISQGIFEFACLVGMVDGDSCGPAVASQEEVERVLDTADLNRLERFRLKAADASLCECPNCDSLCKPNDDTSAVTCPECQAEFCALHAWAHRVESEQEGADPGAVCEAFGRKIQREQAKNESDYSLKQCPSCGVETAYEGGCNHMTCRVCKTDWCWICGQQVDGGNVGWHYSDENPESGCFRYGSPEEHAPLEETRRLRRRRRFREHTLPTLLWYATLPIKGLTFVWLCVAVLVCFLCIAPDGCFCHYCPRLSEGYQKNKESIWAVWLIMASVVAFEWLMEWIIGLLGFAVSHNILLTTISLCVVPGACKHFEKLKTLPLSLLSNVAFLIVRAGLVLICIPWIAVLFLVETLPTFLWYRSRICLVKLGWDKTTTPELLKFYAEMLDYVRSYLYGVIYESASAFFDYLSDEEEPQHSTRLDNLWAELTMEVGRDGFGHEAEARRQVLNAVIDGMIHENSQDEELVSFLRHLRTI